MLTMVSQTSLMPSGGWAPYPIHNMWLMAINRAYEYWMCHVAFWERHSRRNLKYTLHGCDITKNWMNNVKILQHTVYTGKFFLIFPVCLCCKCVIEYYIIVFRLYTCTLKYWSDTECFVFELQYATFLTWSMETMGVRYWFCAEASHRYSMGRILMHRSSFSQLVSVTQFFFYYIVVSAPLPVPFSDSGSQSPSIKLSSICCSFICGEYTVIYT